ncbi:hypothetical protein CFC21_002573 [Triticum aestivum]|uniref:CUE domain-containing protein n=2 Tax=Triticum TaxID=4564 RepID=M7Z6A9_TRIUA|nr:uncharacterized protein LOC119278250 [Triticum dicoccoides]XP_044334472.1 uncharacterized protein LOC123054703 [Triticum aestivum]XP_048550116.1 uncharacterized protein LOC125529739 [Triticum urartu]EMS55502.1 hypothetical protein TRIUR3_30084 [Triticum urartu]KAF6984590.1 hypothetical protein CFC21_002573 [Triticum aestivum]
MDPSRKHGATGASSSSSSADGTHTSCKFEEEARMTGDALLVLDGLVQVFPQVNFSTLIEVSISFNGDADAAADYVIHNVLPNSTADDNNASTNDDSDIHGQHQVFSDTNTSFTIPPVDDGTIPKSVQFDAINENSAEHGENSMGEQLMQSPAAASTSGQDGLPEEIDSDSVLAGAQNSVVDHEVAHSENEQKEMNYLDPATEDHRDEQIHSSSEENQAEPTSEDISTLHGDDSPDMNVRSNYSVSPESIDDAISAENCKKNTLLSNVAAISEMLEEVEVSEAETKHVVSEASQAGNDILVKAAKLKEMSTLAAEENNKVAAEVFAEKSILASEAQGLQSWLFDISEERKHFISVIDEMHQTLQRRLDLAEAERAAAEMEMIEREKMAQEMLKEQEVLLDAAKEESKKLEQQAEENVKLRELLMDRGHVVDALHGEMLGIFGNIVQLQRRVDMGVPADEQRQLASSILSSSVESAAGEFPAEEPPQLAPMSFPSPVQSAHSGLIYVDEPLELASSSLAGSVVSAPSKLLPVGESLDQSSSSLVGSVVSAPSKLFSVCEPLQLASSSLSSSIRSATSGSSWSSATESNSGFNDEEEIAVASPRDNFALDDTWDVVEDEECVC